MSNEWRLHNTIELIYRSVLEPDLIPSFLDAISQELNGVGATFIPVTSNTNLPVYVSSNLTDATSEYISHWWQHDPGMKMARKLNFPIGVHDAYEIIGGNVIKVSIYYNEFARKYDFSAFLSMTMPSSTGGYISLNIQRPIGAGPATQHERQLLKLFHFHMLSAFKISDSIAARPHEAAFVESAERNINGIAIVDSQQRVTFANSAMTAFAARGLSIRNMTGQAKLTVLNPRVQSQLDHLIGRALNRLDLARLGMERAGSEPEVLAIPGQDTLPLLVSAIPLMGQTSEQVGFMPRTNISALVTVVDPEISIASAPFAALQSLGLTRSEAAVAVLVGAGKSPAEAAPELGLTPETVRTYLKSSFGKLRIERQSQLSNLIARISAL